MWVKSPSIKENLLLGNENSTDQEIDEALKKAEAYDFVYEL
jgi:ABC-type multidrug transport system fused ATPase/permease subunit